MANVSLAGEFAVLSQLALKGKNANMTLGNTKGVDILVSDPVSGKMLTLEVKTNYRKTPRKEIARSKIFGNFLSCSGWILKKENEKYDKKKNTNLFYCFVNITKETGVCRFFIVPAKIVAKYVKEEHKLWLRMKKKEGKKVKDSDMRQFRLGIIGEKYEITTPIGKNYENNWDFKEKFTK